MLTCSRSFIYFLRPSSFNAKVTDAESACIRNAKSFCIKVACSRHTCNRDTYIRNNSSAVSACIKNADRKSTCTGDTSVFKHSKIHLQSFSISEIELFNID